MPVSITLQFRNKKEKDKFLSDLADGFGEDHCQLFWGQENGVDIYNANTISITPWGVLDDESDEFNEFDDYGMTKMQLLKEES